MRVTSINSYVPHGQSNIITDVYTVEGGRVTVISTSMACALIRAVVVLTHLENGESIQKLQG
jgi:formiminotetrahydrofolate cyclodeaminase